MGGTYKRVYRRNIIKYMATIGTVSGVSLLFIFSYLASIDVINIEGYSGDMVCGSETNPCYAYINFTMNKDYIYLYPNGSWYEPSIGEFNGFYTDESTDDFKELWMEVRDKRTSSGWRRIDLTRPCAWLKPETTCRYKYSYRFYKTKGLWEIRFVAIKKDPSETIKWGFDTIDPYWFGEEKEEITYTPSTETHCNNGKCWTSLYSGIRFVNEDGKWKNVEDARSLKGSGIECIVESDGENLVKCLDWNYTSIKLEFSIKSTSIMQKEVPIKIYERNENGDLVLKSETKESFSSFNNKKGVELSDFRYGNVIHFGEKSTTIQLQDADTENLDDCRVYELDPDNKAGSYQYINFGFHYTVYIKFNITEIPDDKTVDDANVFFFIYSNSYDAGETCTSDIYGVNNNTWNETTLTWNNRMDVNDFLYRNDTFDGDDDDFWISYNVTSWISDKYNSGDSNITLFLNATTEYSSGSMAAYSKEYTTDASLRPYLNITYSESDTTPPTLTWSDQLEANETLTDYNKTWIYWNFTSNETIGMNGCKIEINGTNITGTIDNLYCYYNETGLTGNVTRCAYGWANDTSDNWGKTEYRCITTNEQQDTGNLSLNLSFGPVGVSIFRWETCGSTFENDSAVPQGQNTSHGIDYVCNDGDAGAGDIQIKMNQCPSSNWTIYASNTSISANLINLTDTWQTIYTSLGQGNCIYIWFIANCSYVIQNPGAYEQFRIV